MSDKPKYMPDYPICPVCREQHVYVMKDEITGDDWLEMFECDVCGWTGDDPDYAFDEQEEIELVNMVIRTRLWLRVRIMESPYNPERFYFRQELVNGLFEE